MPKSRLHSSKLHRRPPKLVKRSKIVPQKPRKRFLSDSKPNPLFTKDDGRRYVYVMGGGDRLLARERYLAENPRKGYLNLVDESITA